ncbi:hypothetical protein WICMUC_005439 [Wickerhamomyces mucosus]|uniref:Uncharacterized protein n=1 Tax=Wickerhamomyces mucosus TaxID=1378264 RepID=A0A9P8P958_9ASCO|nr:hypothetical protein WICMUC_005439 [Wickerhamomyces mucosus]
MPKFKQVDVFTSVNFKGNPVAVFFDADNLTDKELQSIANWTNLSETTFVLEPTNPKADYRVRIFTPIDELPFAGHPTIGTSHAVIQAGLVKPNDDGIIVQESAVGLVSVKVKDGGLQFKLPFYKHEIYDLNSDLIKGIIKSLGSTTEKVKRVVLVEDGPRWLTIQFNDGEDVKELKTDSTSLIQISQKSGLDGFSCFGKFSANSHDLIDQSLTYEARNFVVFGSYVVEDPVCGSGAGADSSLLAEFEDFEGDLTIRQGRNLGRNGIIKVSVTKQQNGDNSRTIYVGGNAVTVLDGNY